MAIGDAYSDAPTYRGRIGMTDTTKDGAILADLVAISRYIDRQCERFFTHDAAPVTRVVYPRGYHGGDPEAENPWRGIRGGRLLDLDAELAGLPTSVIIDLNRQGNFNGYTALTNPDASGITGGDYQLWPLNQDKGPEPKPWYQLYIPTWSTQFGFPPGCPVQIIAPWGWPAIPEAVKRACEQIAGILRIDNPRASAQLAEGIDVAIAESPDAQGVLAKLLKSYKRERIFA